MQEAYCRTKINNAYWDRLVSFLNLCMRNFVDDSPVQPTVRPLVLVVEGVDCSGKTTLAHLLQIALAKQMYRVKVLHDPTGSNNGAMIWNMILTLQHQGIHPATEFFLFLAARNELIYQEAWINQVDIVIFDRFIFSTIAYQLTDKPHFWTLFLTLHRSFSRLMPDLCIYCDLDFDTFLLRRQTRDKQDLLDQIPRARFEAIQWAYEQILQRNLCKYFRVDTTKDFDITLLVEQIIGYITPIAHA